ncbi:MAG: hypothetical protein CMF33_07975 [Leeuwenhoekiella sp.]|nr:hypothetical protein [Leeuwenhoekiella sp.]
MSNLTYGQNKEADEILKEGKLLFRLEKGSWYGTDDLLAQFKSKIDSIGGYLSYETDEHKIKTIFFSRFNPEEILVRYEFDSLPRRESIKVDTTNSLATNLEKDLITIRQDAKDQAALNEDGFFSFYENTSLNFIPLINKNQRSVFVLTGPQTNGVVLIGNDYKLKYSNTNKFLKKERIHKSMLQVPYASANDPEKILTTMHSHIVTDPISSTDICTLLLYKNFVQWNQHIVMSKKKVSIFDLQKETLFIMSKKAWDKIYK